MREIARARANAQWRRRADAGAGQRERGANRLPFMRGNNAPISLLLAASLTSAMHTSAMHTSVMHTSPSAVSVNFLRFRGGAAAVPKAVEKSIMVDDEAKLLQALRSGQISAEAICKNSDTALHLACRHGANRCLELLLAEPGFDKDCRRETDGCTPLMTCMQGGHLGCVTLLLNAGAEVNLQEFTAGTPALHYACRWGHADCLAALFRRPGVKVDLARDLDGVSALHVAAFNGQDACVTALLTARASTAQRSREHLSALDYACREGHESTTRILLDAKAPSDIGPAELGGTAPLHWAATGGPNGVAEAGHVGCLQALLEAGVHPDLLRTRDGSSALHYAAIGNLRVSNEECVRVLLEGGSNPNLRRVSDDVPPLHLAAQSGSVASVSLLLRAGAKVNACVANRAQSELGKLISKTTALDLAIQGRHSAVVQMLERAGGVQGSLLPDSALEDDAMPPARRVYAKPATRTGDGKLTRAPASAIAAASVVAAATLATLAEFLRMLSGRTGAFFVVEQDTSQLEQATSEVGAGALS